MVDEDESVDLSFGLEGKVQCDVADPSSAENSVHSVLTEFGHVDVLVNCAGVVVVAPAEDLTSPDGRRA